MLARSLTLTGGPATGLAFAPLFEEAGLTGAATLATAAAMAGIVSSGLRGNPLGAWLIERRKLRPGTDTAAGAGGTPALRAGPGGPVAEIGADDTRPIAVLLRSAAAGPALVRALVVLLVDLWAGSWLSAAIEALGVTLPAYVVGAFFIDFTNALVLTLFLDLWG